MTAPDAIGELELVAESSAQRAPFERVEITVRGAGGMDSITMPALAWERLSPAGKVLAIHEARRDLTRGRPFYLRVRGVRMPLRRPLNARSPYPLFMQYDNEGDEDELPVFNDDGTFSDEMRAFLLRDS